MNDDFDIEATKDMRVLREAPKFEVMARRAEWSVNMKDYTMDTIITIGGSRKKLKQNFIMDFDGTRQIIPVAKFNLAMKEIMQGQPFTYQKFRMQRINSQINKQASDNTMCAASLGGIQAIIDIEEMLGYTRLV